MGLYRYQFRKFGMTPEFATDSPLEGDGFEPSVSV
jgi:hypothetical protein